MVAPSRAVIITLAVAAIGTFYSLSELHRISAVHLDADTSADELISSDHLLPRGSRKPGGKPITIKTSSSTDSSSSSDKQQLGSRDSPKTVADSSSRTKCYTYDNTELWGDVVVWGPQNKLPSAGACCEACQAAAQPRPGERGCNVWVWNKDPSSSQYKECWLKHLAHPEASKPANEGPGTPWTAGTLGVDIKANPGSDMKNKVLRTFHTVTSAQGTAVHWQIRIHYYHFKKQKHACEQAGRCEMGGFTRLLHSGQADDLMDEIPTVVVDPLPKETVEHGWYVVLNRPYAFVQWVKKQKIPEKYVLMSEPDHVMIRPLPNFMMSEDPAAFPFFYIEPGSDKNAPITQKFTGKLSRQELDEIAPIGNSPTFMALKDMHTVMPLWMNTSIDIFKDREASKEWGWVQEMYGFCIGLWLGGVKHVSLYLHMMSQPPWDDKLMYDTAKPFHIIHYTYGMDYNLDGEFTPGKYGQWRFDKRAFTGRPLPRNLAAPPPRMKNELVRALLNAFNEATDAIPCWDDYQKTGKVPAPSECTEPKKGFLKTEQELGLNPRP